MQNFAPRAQADLDELVGWLLDHGSAAKAAETLLTTVLEAAARLAERPLLGRRRPELLPDPFRFWSLPKQGVLLIYTTDLLATTILRVVRTNRDLGPILEDLVGDLGESG